MGPGLLHHGVGEPPDIEHDLGMLERAVMAALPGQQAFDADLSSPLFIGPAGAVLGDEVLAVVLVHRRIDALLRIWRGGDQIDPEAIHVRRSATF